MQTKIEILQSEIAALAASLKGRDQLLAKKDLKIARLEEEIRLQLLARFGRKSEVFVDPNQPALFNEVESDAALASLELAADVTEVGPYKKRRGHRKPLPESLSRTRIEHDLSDDEKFCKIHGSPLIKIGEDVSEQLEIIPEQINVTQHVRPKYKCPCCEGNIKQCPAPLRAIPGSMASPSLLAFIAVSKYVDHLPLYRLEKRFERISVNLPRLTMARWMIKTSEVLTPLYNMMQDDLLAGGILQMDETPVQVLKEPNREASTKSYMWVRARDRSTGPPIILFDYFPSRSSRIVGELLSGYRGILQTDGYRAYDSFAVNAEIIHAGCMAHCRRKLWEAFKAAGKVKNTLAEQGLNWIKEIYKVEAEAKLLGPKDHLAYRQAKMTPLLTSFKDWIDDSINKVPATLKTGEALSYISEQWPKLQHVLSDSRIPLDTNFVEGRIRPFTLGRKNWMFSDTQAGAHASAMFYSILETAKANHLEPFSYLQSVIENLPKATTASEIEALLPYNFAKKNLH